VLLGAVELIGPDGTHVRLTRPQPQLVLARLLLARGPVTRDELAELLWGERPLSSHWRGALRGVLSKVRGAIDEAGIGATLHVSAEGTVRLELPPELTTDVDEGERAVDRAERATDPADALASAASWGDHLDRPFLVAGDGDWVRTTQERLTDLARRATLAELRALHDLGRNDEAVDRASRWVRRHPLDEAAHHVRIQALVAAGRRGEATVAHEELARILDTELGVAPAAATTALLVDRSTAPAFRLLGRTDELGALRLQLSTVAATGRPALTLISGPSGIGKTRLAHELRTTVPPGTTVCWGRCLPASGLPFEPLAAMALDAIGERQRAGSERDDLALDLAEVVEARPGTADPMTTRTHRFRTIARAIRHLATEPTVLVIDDLQWATGEVISLVEEVLTQGTGPLLVVATGRDLPAPVHEALARLRRTVSMSTIDLQGLVAADLAPLFAEREPEAAQAAAEALARRTGGLPLYVQELSLATGDAEATAPAAAADDLPPSIRDWLAHRIDALPPQGRRCLEAAAVLGPEVELGALASLVGEDEGEVLGHLEALGAAGLLVEDDAPGRFAFAHLLTQEAVYDRIGATRRARLHQAVAEAVLAGDVAPGRHATAARHLAAAGPDHRARAAVEMAAAANEALDQGAWDLADAWSTEAEAHGEADPLAQAEARVSRGRVRYHQGRIEEAEALLLEGLTIARAHRLALPHAEAALALVGRAGRGAGRHLDDAGQAELLREALDALDERSRRDPTPADRGLLVRRETLACRLEIELALAGILTAPPDQRDQLTERAARRAARLDPPDPQLTARAVLGGRISKLAPHRLDERIADADLVLATSGIGIEARITALAYRAEDLARRGDREASRAGFAAAEELAARTGHPYWRWALTTWSALHALIDGELAAAEALAAAALELQGDQVPEAVACFGVNLVDLRLYQGRAGEVLDLLRGAVDGYPQIPCYRAVLALCAAEADERAEAAAAYDAFRSERFANIPDDSNRLLALVVLADVATQLEDQQGVRWLEPLLAPHQGHQALLNCYGGGGAYWGPVDHQLARLAAADGDADLARRRFAAAEVAATRFGAVLAAQRIAADPLRPSPP
jgi:DNA-binding SARP family transcriptional activator